jgi:hypothetical protein
VTQVAVDFKPQKCGEFKSELLIRYDSSEAVYVRLYDK